VKQINIYHCTTTTADMHNFPILCSCRCGKLTCDRSLTKFSQFLLWFTIHSFPKFHKNRPI